MIDFGKGSYKERILHTLFEVTEPDRDTSRLSKYLESSDFFKAPSSIKHHGAKEGGLAEHSWNVYVILDRKNKDYDLGLTPANVAVTALCHDLCKIDFYKMDDEPATSQQLYRLKKEMGSEPPEGVSKRMASNLIDWHVKGRKGMMPSAENAFKVVDSFPVGHGSKSALLLARYFNASDLELAMVTHHMGPMAEVGFSSDSKSYENAVIKYPQCVALHTADYEASTIIENESWKVAK